MTQADTPFSVIAYSPAHFTVHLGSWIVSLLILLAGTFYGVMLAGPGAGLGFDLTDKILALSILVATATGRIPWLLFSMGATISGIAWARRVIDLGFGNMQLTEYMVLGMVINVILHFIVHPVSIPRNMKRLMLCAFLPASAFALAASIGGWLNGNPEFVRPLRACLVVVGFLYAFLNIRNSDLAKRVFFGVVYLAVMTYIIRFAFYFSDITLKGLGPFLLAAIVISILLLPKISPAIRVLIILPVLLFALVNLTLTIFLSIALAIALYFSYYARTKIVRQLMVFCLIVSTLMISLVVANVLRDELVLGAGSTLMNMDSGFQKEDILSDPLSRIQYKVYDRVVLWAPAIMEIAVAPFQLNAGGRPLMVGSLNVAALGEETSWTIHAHNVFIEVMRQFSLPGSIFFNVIIIAALITLWRGLRLDKRYNSSLVAWSLFGLSFLPGFMLGFYPVAGEIGVYFWLAAGISYKLRLLSDGM